MKKLYIKWDLEKFQVRTIFLVLVSIYYYLRRKVGLWEVGSAAPLVIVGLSHGAKCA